MSLWSRSRDRPEHDSSLDSEMTESELEHSTSLSPSDLFKIESMLKVVFFADFGETGLDFGDFGWGEFKFKWSEFGISTGRPAGRPAAGGNECGWKMNLIIVHFGTFMGSSELHCLLGTYLRVKMAMCRWANWIRVESIQKGRWKRMIWLNSWWQAVRWHEHIHCIVRNWNKKLQT